MDEEVRRELASRFFEEAYRRQMKGELEAAVELYSKSIESFPTAEAYTFRGWTYRHMGRLDDAIAEMLAYDGPVMFDCRVHKTSNCFPMIPSGAAHTDMILHSDEVSGTMDDEAKALV